MKTLYCLFLLLCGCASQHHSTVDAALLKAQQSAQSTRQDISAIKAGANTVDYKAGRALQFFR